MNHIRLNCASLVLFVAVLGVPGRAATMEGVRHFVVASEPGKFLGWPANSGQLWAWGNELLVPMTAADFVDQGPDRHAYAPERAQHIWLARSRDGGATWKVEKPDALRGHKDSGASAQKAATGDIQSSNPNLTIIVGYENEDSGHSWFQVSPDRGRTWGPREQLPDFGLDAVNGRTDYLLSGENDALFLLTGQSSHKPKEGRVFAARTRDGGKTWTREGFVGPDPKDGFSIQSSTVRINMRLLVSATRLQETGQLPRAGIQIHRSDDDGRTWRTLDAWIDTGKHSTAVSLILLRDGRLALTYSQRDHGAICARLSDDDGASWSEEIVLRDKAGNWDIGYPRSVQRADDKIVTAYYWNDDPHHERYIAATIWSPPRVQEHRPEARHGVVYHASDKMAAWPANGGLWTWDDGREALVGFCAGKFREQRGHNIDPPHLNLLARSLDGGDTWTLQSPKGYPQDGDKAGAISEPVDFGKPGFAMRMTGTGYHGSTQSAGVFSYSYDRGQTWKGSYSFSGLADAEPLRGMEITTRTDYLVSGAKECLLLMAARKPSPLGDRTFAARTTDGGRHFEFLGWLIGPDDPYRAVMPATVQYKSGKLVSALRRREIQTERCWIDVCMSEDDGKTWRIVSTVASTGGANGNPPALVRLEDGRLCCVYGDRDRRAMLARLSVDGGLTWGAQLVLRDDYRADKHGDADFGYPRTFQRPDGRIATLYYWSDKEHPEPHIDVTIWIPPKQ